MSKASKYGDAVATRPYFSSHTVSAHVNNNGRLEVVVGEHGAAEADALALAKWITDTFGDA